MQIPLVLGRDLSGRDVPGATRVGIVNETFAHRYFAGQSPLGQIFYFGGGTHSGPQDRTEIVGVCKDAKYANLGTERMFAQVVGSFGLIAALLAAIGLYGVMAYTVTRRTSEIGIRLALGAGRSDVQWMVLRESLWMVAAGMVVGIPAALALTQLVREALYGIQPNDPFSFVAAGAFMVAVAAVAAWIPALRAARVDPMRALRCE
jgi:ABC-type antimicrobial peptide transport system permease subunit